MVFRNTMHMGNGAVIRAQTTTTPALRLAVEDWCRRGHCPFHRNWTSQRLRGKFRNTKQCVSTTIKNHLRGIIWSMVMHTNKISYIFDDFTFWESAWRKSWRSKTIRSCRLHMFVKALASFTFDDWAWFSNMELGPTFPGGSFPHFQGKSWCVRESFDCY